LDAEEAEMHQEIGRLEIVIRVGIRTIAVGEAGMMAGKNAVPGEKETVSVACLLPGVLRPDRRACPDDSSAIPFFNRR
jgi:hypothetical protein